jgi:N-acyl-D-aspartate/D-glutamate deacylase
MVREGTAIEFETLIQGGTVVDGTGAARHRADVGLRGGRIVAVGRLEGATAARVIDATGRVVAPGFIDIHSHSDVTLLDDPGGESKVHQGVTTDVSGNCSYSPFPIGPGGFREMRDIFGPELTSERDWDWTDLDGWAARHHERGISMNLAPLVGHAALRVAVGATGDRAPTADELSAMQHLAAESVEQGAFGLSTGLTLTPGSYSTTEEIIALATAIAPYPGAFYATHARLWAGQHVAAVEESARIGIEGGVPVEYSHIAIIDKRAYGHPEDMIAVVDRARDRGLDITFDVYPYIAAGTGLMQFVPEWAQAGGVQAMLDRLRDPATRARVRISTAEGWFRGMPWDWESMVLSDIGTDANRPLIGRSIAEAASIRGEDPLDTFLNLIDEESNGVAVVVFNRREPDMRAFLVHEAAMVGSDGTAISPAGVHGPPKQPHPRYYGTFPRILGRYVRDEPVLTLESAIHKMTGMPARRLGLTDRGRVAEGAAADLVVFDPATIIDRASFESPHQYPAGIEAVLVNGEVVVTAGNHTGARPGRVLRRGA